MALQRQKRGGGQQRLRAAQSSTVLSAEAFRRTFHRERLLADRGHRHFSVAIFRMPAHAFRATQDPDVAEVILRHVRLTDDTGFLHGAVFGVLLRETEPDGAAAFCKRVAADLAKSGANVAWGSRRGATRQAPAPGRPG